MPEGSDFGGEAKASVCQTLVVYQAFSPDGGPVTDTTIPQSVLFPELGGKAVVATFDR